MKNTTKTKRRLPLKWKIFSCFAGFIAAILALLWVFQIWLLDDFYFTITSENLKASGSALASAATDDLQVTADKLALNHEFCVLVFDESGKRIASSETSGSCIIHKLGSDNLNSLFASAEQEGGVHIGSIRLDGSLARPNINRNSDPQGEEQGVLSDGPLDEKTEQRLAPSLSRLVYSAVLAGPDGESRYILLDCPMAPVSAIRDTLRTQLCAVSIFAAVAALAAAMILSRRISRPIVGLSASADRLAGGDYNTEFRGGGCREIDDLSATLTYASKELSKVDTMQRELIANISHDLRTPLTMIGGYVEVMRDIPGENTPENLQVILDETGRLTALVNDLVDVSKIQNGKKEYRFAPFSLSDAIRETVARFTKLNECDGFRFSFDGTENVTAVGDRSAILQVLYNLIGNAVNYTGEDKTVSVTLRVNNGMARVDVCDTGAGIPEEELPHIFDRYYRATHENHKRGVGGAGIGLSVVKTVLDAHRVPFGVISTVGEGSDFWFSLPTA